MAVPSVSSSSAAAPADEAGNGPIIKPALPNQEVVPGGGRDHPDRLRGMVQLQTPIHVNGKIYKLRFRQSDGTIEIGELRDVICAIKPAEIRAGASSTWASVRFGKESLDMGIKKVPTTVTPQAVLAWQPLPRVIKEAILSYPRARFVDWTPLERVQTEVDRYEVEAWKPPSVAHKIFVVRHGSITTLQLRAKTRGEVFLSVYEPDRSINIIQLIRLIWNREYHCDRGITPHLLELIKLRFGTDAIIDYRLSTWLPGDLSDSAPETRATLDGSDDYIVAVSLKATAALWLFDRYRPEALPWLKQLIEYDAAKCPPFAAYEGPRSVEARQDSLQMLKTDIAHLGALTFSRGVSDMNADHVIDIKALRKGNIPMDQMRAEPRLLRFTKLLEASAADNRNISTSAVSSTLWLPKLPSGEVALTGHFQLGIGDAHPHLGCHLCMFSTPNGYQNLVTHHLNDIHNLHQFSAAREAWQRASDGWDVILVNLQTASITTLKTRYHLWGYYDETGEDVIAQTKLVRAYEERDLKAFGKEGDDIVWFVCDYTVPDHPLLDAFEWHQKHPLATGDNDILQEADGVLDFLLFTWSVFKHLLVPSDTGGKLGIWYTRTSLSKMANMLPSTAVITLLQTYGPSSHLLRVSNLNLHLANILTMLADRASIRSMRWLHDNPISKFTDVTGFRVDHRLWPFTWSTFDVNSIKPITYTELTRSLDKGDWIVILIFRRTRGGGWVLVGVIIIVLLAALRDDYAAMLNRYLESGQFRYDLIATDLNLQPQDLPYSAVLLDNCPCDSPSVPALQEICGMQGQPDICFSGHKEVFECDGYIDGRQVIMSLSSYDGFFALPDTLIEFFGKWRGGFLAILTEDRRIMGLQKTQEGIFHHVYVYVPAFVHFLLDKKAKKMEESAQYALDTECVLPDEIAYQRAMIAEAKLLRQSSKLGRELSIEEEELMVEVTRRMSSAVQERETLKAARNIRGASTTRSGRRGDGTGSADVTFFEKVTEIMDSDFTFELSDPRAYATRDDNVDADNDDTDASNSDPLPIPSMLAAA